MEDMDKFHERKARELFDKAWKITKERYPIAAETLIRDVVFKLLRSACLLAEARCNYRPTNR